MERDIGCSKGIFTCVVLVLSLLLEEFLPLLCLTAFILKYPRDTSTDTRTFHLQGAPFIFMPLINHHIVELTMEPQALEFRLHRT